MMEIIVRKIVTAAKARPLKAFLPVSKGQCAMRAAILQPFATEKGGRGNKAPKTLGGFSAERLRQARMVLRFNPELADEVLTRVRSLDAALKVINGDTRKRAATHEAGHAIIGRVVNVVCGLASIDRDRTNGNRGMSEFGEWDSCGRIRPERYGRDAEVILHMAGAEAECELLGSSCGGDQTDREKILVLLADVPDADRIDKRLRRMTRMLVRRHAAPISYVADILVKHGTLSGAEIDSWWASVRRMHLTGQQ